MTIIYEISAVAAIAVFIWLQIKTRQQIHAINERLTKMKQDVDVLRVRESRRTLMAFKARANAESPRIELDDDSPATIRSQDIVTGTTRSAAVQ